MDINKHNEKIWDKYLDFDYETMKMVLVNQTRIL